MFGFRFDRYRWVHVVVASGSVGVSGCVDRAYDFEFVAAETTDGTGPTSGNPTEPTGTNPTDPTDPTVDPTDPTGYVPGIPGPPQLVEILFLDNLTLELRFNEGMSPPSGVDPTQFRLSFAIGQQQNYDYGTFTIYQELAYWNGPENCYENCYDPCNYDYTTGCTDSGGPMCYEYCYPSMGPPVHGFSLELDYSSSDRIRLRLDQGISSGVCKQAMNYPPDFTAGLFLHFTDQFVPVVDAQGEALGPIGPRWALMPEQFSYYRPEFFPELQPLLPIPCPF